MYRIYRYLQLCIVIIIWYKWFIQIQIQLWRVSENFITASAFRKKEDQALFKWSSNLKPCKVL